VLPGGRLLVEATAGATAVAPAAAGVAGWQAWTAADRVARDLTRPASGQAVGRRIPIVAHVAPGGDPDAVAADLAAAGDVVASGPAGDWGRVVALVEPAAMAAATSSLLRHDDVFFVERIRHVGLLNGKLVGSIQSGVQGHGADVTPIWQHGLRGENQIVGLIDTGADPDTCYTAGAALPQTNTWSESAGYGTAVDLSHRKIIAYDFLFSCAQYPTAPRCDDPTAVRAWDNHGHGTHIIGSIAGDSDEHPDIYVNQDGLAPAAKVVVQDAGFGTDDCADLPGLGCPVIDLGPLYAQSYAQGARIVNNSWGDDENLPPPDQSNYTARTQDVDRFMWEHPDYLIVFAAGNSGGGNAEFSVGSPATMKNGLSVGSTRRTVAATSDDNISGFSSRGWSADGRIKPDLMAPGCNASAGTDRMVGTATCGTDQGCGTSYASPVVVGAAALVRQYFTDGRYRGTAFTPSAALIKAVLLNSSVSMRGTDNSQGPITPIPSNEQGWGRVQLDRALAFAGSPFALFVDDHRAGLAAGDRAPRHYAFDVDGSADLKVTLDWTDYPGVPDQAPSAPSVGNSATWNAPQLVNDLDLEVIDPGELTYLGNQFTGGESVLGGAPDRRNNVEQVRLPSPRRGRVVVTVRPHDISVAGQQYALVVTGNATGGDACAMAPEAAAPTAVAQPTRVALAWTDPAGAGDYVVQRAASCDATTWSPLAAVSEPAYVDTSVMPGERYAYRVRGAAIAAGQCLPARWQCVEVTVPAQEPDAGVPDAPAPEPDAMVEPDAGAMDAQVPPPDAEPDAGKPEPLPDAGGADGGNPGTPDAGTPGGEPGGCGCRTGGSGSAAPLMLIALGMIVRRRRR